MTRVWALFACIPFVATVSACGKGDRGDANATGSAAHTPTTPTALPIDAPDAPAIDVSYALPVANVVARRPANPAAYVFVQMFEMKVGTTPSLAAATVATDIDSLVKLLPPDPAKAAAAPDADAGTDTGWGTIGTGSIGALNHGGGSGAGFGPGGGPGAGMGYGLGGGGGTYIAYSLRGARKDPAEARIVLVAARDVPIEKISGIVLAIGEPIAVAVNAAPNADALAVTLEAGSPSDGSKFSVSLFSTGATIHDLTVYDQQVVPNGTNGNLDPVALAKMVGAIDPNATVSLELALRASFSDLIVGLDAAAGRMHPIPVSVRAGGGMYGRNAKVPQVRIGQPNTVGDLDKAIIRRYIKRNIQKITYCYEKELTVKKDLDGTVVAEFVIGADGKVPQAKASGMNNTVAICIASVIHEIEFPKPKSGIVKVSYPFTFQPTGG